jgi:hypothetical protein
VSDETARGEAYDRWKRVNTNTKGQRAAFEAGAASERENRMAACDEHLEAAAAEMRVLMTRVKELEADLRYQCEATQANIDLNMADAKRYRAAEAEREKLREALAKIQRMTSFDAPNKHIQGSANLWPIYSTAADALSGAAPAPARMKHQYGCPFDGEGMATATCVTCDAADAETKRYLAANPIPVAAADPEKERLREALLQAARALESINAWRPYPGLLDVPRKEIMAYALEQSRIARAALGLTAPTEEK